MTNHQDSAPEKEPTSKKDRDQRGSAENRETRSSSAAGATAESASTKDPHSRATSPKVWADLQENLTHALSTWEHLSVESEHKLSPAEEQMQEVKRLLHELKDKLREFSK